MLFLRPDTRTQLFMTDVTHQANDNRALRSMPRGSLILSAHRTYKKHGQSFTRNTITQIDENNNKR